MSRKGREWQKFAATRLAGLAVDSLFLLFAYFSSILLRFDLHIPHWGIRAVMSAFLVVWVVHIAALSLAGCYRLSWRLTRINDIPRYLVAAAAACVVLTSLRFMLPVVRYAYIRPPYSVTLISFVLSSVVLVGWRIIWSWLWVSGRRDDSILSRNICRMNDAGTVEFFRGKVVMVTGAGGSIGSEIVRQVASFPVKSVLLVERGENQLYEIDREMRSRQVSAQIVPLMKDINDVEEMANIFSRYSPAIVIHAAAYKHVPMVEMNPDEGWRNNTGATQGLADLAKRHGVERFVLVSTDKAVNPVSVMGKTKAAAEKAIMALNADSGTSFCAVRFGNVLGSSGSVVPLFKELISNRLPVTVTHPQMQRYFMTVSEAVGLVLQAAGRKEKAIYTLDMGSPVKIVDLAESLIRQAGLRPYVDIPIVFTGIRPGEKLFEELDVSEKSAYRTDMAKIYITRNDEKDIY